MVIVDLPSGARSETTVTVVAARSLTPALLGAWRRLRSLDPALAGPCFSPEFTLACARTTEGVQVAVVEREGEVVALLPFERRDDTSGVPVGAPMNDFQGFVTAPTQAFDVVAVLRACGLRRLSFDHALASQTALAPYHRQVEASPFLDLSAGFAAWSDHRPRAGLHPLARLLTLERKLAREVGALRFDPCARDPALLATLMAWKGEQYLRSGLADLFAAPRPRHLLQEIHATQEREFAGVLSGLWAGGELLALHFGMRSATVWHYWFPAYARRFARYSPGLLLLLHMARAAEALGLRTIDLGRDAADYKARLMSGEVLVAQGAVELEPAPSAPAPKVDDLEIALRDARDEAQALRASLSWRLSAPLRRGYDLLRALRRPKAP